MAKQDWKQPQQRRSHVGIFGKSNQQKCSTNKPDVPEVAVYSAKTVFPTDTKAYKIMTRKLLLYVLEN